MAVVVSISGFYISIEETSKKVYNTICILITKGITYEILLCTYGGNNKILIQRGL